MTLETTPTFFHLPVLTEAVIQGLDIQENGHYLDATVGGGGHSELMLKAGKNVTLTALVKMKARSKPQKKDSPLQFLNR